MKIQDKNNKKILYLLLVGLALWAAYAALFSRGTFLAFLPFDFSEYQVSLRALFLVGLGVFGILAVLFSLLVKRILIQHHVTGEQYKNLVELSSDIITVSDRDGKAVFMNETAYRILELAPEEVIGRPFTELLHPADRAKSLAKHKVLEKSNTESYGIEMRYITKSGKVINTQQNVSVLKDQKGAFIGTQSIARDITERRQAEDALRQAIARAEEEKARTESLLSQIGDGISVQDADFKILYQNQAHKTMTNGDRVGHTCHQAFASSDGVCSGCPVTEVFMDGNIHVLEKSISRNGEVRFMEIKASPLRDAAGMIIAAIEAVRDITARRNMEEKLQLFSSAIGEAMDGIQIIDLNGRIVYSNKAIRELSGFSPEELVGRRINDLSAGSEFADQVVIPKTRETGSWSGEFPAVHKDGRTFPVRLSTALVKDEHGQPLAMIGIMRDISDHKQTEDVMKQHHDQLMKLVEERTRELSTANEQLRKEIADRARMEQELLKAQKLESLGILASGIAHDFNNLLASITGNIGLAMLDMSHDNSAYQQLAGAEKASIRAQDLTRQLLTFAKGGEPVKKAVSVSDLIRDVTGFTLPNSKVKFFYSLPEDLWLAESDEGQISQVLQNLIINADHAMPEGGTITISSENAVVAESSQLPLKPGDYVKISVRDHGVGISQDNLLRIFDPYFTTKKKGSGLGLATAYSIIKQHGGHIIAESEPGKGTTFIIYLPAALSQKALKRPGELKLFTGTGRILLLDDEEDIRQTTGDVLQRLGYTVESIDDGARAIDLYQKARKIGKPFDAVIMDLTIPGGMGGEETLRKLLEIDPDVKAVASSGYSNDPVMADHRAYGFSGVVSKPYRITDLAETLHAVLQDKGSALRRERS